MADVENAGCNTRAPAPPLIPVALGARREQPRRWVLGGVFGRGAARRGGEGKGKEGTAGRRRRRGRTEKRRSRFAALRVVPCLPYTMALAEVVVCAVGRVVTLPAVEITAQATALLVLVMLSAAEDNGWESPLFSLALPGDSPRNLGARPARPARKPLVSHFPGRRN